MLIFKEKLANYVIFPEIMFQIILKHKEQQIKCGHNHRESELLRFILRMQAWIPRSHILDQPVTTKNGNNKCLRRASIPIPKAHRHS